MLPLTRNINTLKNILTNNRKHIQGLVAAMIMVSNGDQRELKIKTEIHFICLHH